jgi:hypothetical protein
MKQLRFWTRKLYRRAVQEVTSRFYVNPEADCAKASSSQGQPAAAPPGWAISSHHRFPAASCSNRSTLTLSLSIAASSISNICGRGWRIRGFTSFARKVFTGEIRNRWIDRQNERIYSRYRLIKEIRINLALKWLHDNFPEVPILFLMRHPCAVVASRMELGWATDAVTSNRS